MGTFIFSISWIIKENIVSYNKTGLYVPFTKKTLKTK